jgi:hypothetical protein
VRSEVLTAVLLTILQFCDVTMLKRERKSHYGSTKRRELLDQQRSVTFQKSFSKYTVQVLKKCQRQRPLSDLLKSHGNYWPYIRPSLCMEKCNLHRIDFCEIKKFV